MLAALLVVVQFATVTELVSPRPTGWVVDQADILEPADEARLNAIAEQLFTSRKIEMAIVAVDDVKGTPKEFATRLFNHWGIGQAATNNGILVLLVMGKRRLEIEVGTGMEAALTSAWLAHMQSVEMVPKFKAGDFPGGLVAGVAEIGKHLAAAPGESTTTAPVGEYRSDGTVVAAGDPTTQPYIPPRTPPQHYVDDSAAEDEGGAPVGLLVGGLGLLGAGGGAGALMMRKRKKQRTCSHCTPPRAMLKLDEISDDKYISKGAVTEEQVGSVDWEVVVCPGCQTSRMFRHGKWFSGFANCPGCSFKTSKSTSETTVHATYDHGGQIEVTERCAHCNRHNTYTKYTAARTRYVDTDSSSSSSSSSYSSSSSSSSGYSGGSSSGGGAGSSW